MRSFIIGIFRQVKERLRYAGHAARMGRGNMNAGFFVGKPENQKERKYQFD
jgi:hypothetical protein